MTMDKLLSYSGLHFGLHVLGDVKVWLNNKFKVIKNIIYDLCNIVKN